MAIRFRSRHASWKTGSIPSAATSPLPATADMCAEDVGLSVTLAASA
jgi:hypothetical protein